ncbi:GIY-YIG nuclease family protein [Pseudonocardia sp. ICBG1034]|uniref:GIY-YIG nuclease family protein n=1 Tax=Pseudonocardia sp. ICBG1034 TaxID=2844381 RepID=UPI0035A99EC1
MPGGRLPPSCPTFRAASVQRFRTCGFSTSASRRSSARLASNHLRRSGSSTLCRTLAGLLLDEQQYRTRWSDRVVLVDDDEAQLTQWMSENVDLHGAPNATPPLPPTISVVRSVRIGGDTDMRRSRRRLGMPQRCVTVLRDHDIFPLA